MTQRLILIFLHSKTLTQISLNKKMSKKEKKIDDYVRGLLSKEEQAAFELAFAKDIDLQKEIQLRIYITNYFEYKQVLDTIQEAKHANENNYPDTEEEDLSKFKSMVQQAKTENKKSRNRKIYLLSTLTIAASFFVFFWFNTYWLNETIDETLSLQTTLSLNQPQIENVALNFEKEIQQLIDESNFAMQNVDYETVFLKFNQLRLLGFETDEMLLYELFIYYKKKLYIQSENCFAKITNKNTETGNEARWYISLVYSASNQAEKAKEELLKIEGHYKKQAKAKLIKMNK